MLEVIMRSVSRVLILFIMTSLTVAAQQQLNENPSQPAAPNQPASDIPSQPAKESPRQVRVIADPAVAQEARLLDSMNRYTPLVETYIQNLKADPEFVTVPGNDRYFLVRIVLARKGVTGRAFKDNNR